MNCTDAEAVMNGSHLRDRRPDLYESKPRFFRKAAPADP